jgi:2-dehydro-3-deoxygalactonokinase
MNQPPFGGSTGSRSPEEVICVDMGTTNTRAWLVKQGQIVSQARHSIGVRDAARTGNTAIVHGTIKKIIHDLQADALSNGRPELVLCAGMITSSLGLREVDHVLAPAGEHELSSAVTEIVDPEVTELPIWLVPGVRTGPRHPQVSDLDEIDVIRGEETLCVGLVQLGILAPQATLLNLGSHWKAITLDSSHRIAKSCTTLSGELIHAIQTSTVLSSALPQDRLTELDFEWLEKGHTESQASNLSRALFCVRILEQRFKLTPLQLSSFLLGAVVGSDLAAMTRNAKLGRKLVIAGTGAPAEAWSYFLKKGNLDVTICNPSVLEAAFVAGLLRLAELRASR